MNPLCVLDFYVYEKTQRAGYGRKIFDKMLKAENVHPAKLAYDRPSTKLQPFLKKHFGLSEYIPQNNNFVIFDKYFSSEAVINSVILQDKPFEPKPYQSHASKPIEETKYIKPEHSEPENIQAEYNKPTYKDAPHYGKSYGGSINPKPEEEKYAEYQQPRQVPAYGYGGHDTEYL